MRHRIRIWVGEVEHEKGEWHRRNEWIAMSLLCLYSNLHRRAYGRVQQWQSICKPYSSSNLCKISYFFISCNFELNQPTTHSRQKCLATTFEPVCHSSFYVLSGIHCSWRPPNPSSTAVSKSCEFHAKVAFDSGKDEGPMWLALLCANTRST